jgi:hypothetical protein
VQSRLDENPRPKAGFFLFDFALAVRRAVTRARSQPTQTWQSELLQLATTDAKSDDFAAYEDPRSLR